MAISAADMAILRLRTGEHIQEMRGRREISKKVKKCKNNAGKVKIVSSWAGKKEQKQNGLFGRERGHLTPPYRGKYSRNERAPRDVF